MAEKNSDTKIEVPNAEDDIYTKDGTVDFYNNPVVRRKTGTWKACPFILGNEFCERLAYYGVDSNLVNYFEKRLNQGTATASNSDTNWGGTCYITPLLGAFIADAYLGRYWTIATFSAIYVVAMVWLTLTVTVEGLKPTCYGPHDDQCDPTATQTAVFYLAIYLIALGTGGIKPCVSSFGADQFDENNESERRMKSSFFNWFYLSINVGGLLASSVLVWLQTNVGYGWGFGVPAVAMAIAVVSFFSGTRLYRHQKPGGSPLTRISQVVVASFRKLRVKVPEKSLLYENDAEESLIKGSRKLDHTKDFSFFDKAAVVTEYDDTKGNINPWRLCTVTQVEEVKSIIRLLPIWASGIMFAAVYGQMSSIFILQGDTLDTSMGPHFKIPPASVSLFDTIAVFIWVPIYDRIIVPLARRYTGNDRGFTQLQRMGIGLVISILSMLSAGALEVERLKTVKRLKIYDKKQTVPLSIFWQVPQFFLVGAAEVFTFIGQLEFFYDQAPDALRSMCSALSLTTVALGKYTSTLLVTIVTHVTTKGGRLGWLPDNLNLGHLDYYYWLSAILSLVNFGIFLVIARWYTYKKPVGVVRG